MRVHSFLSRVALLCNVLFLYCWYLQNATSNFINNKDINAVILILGWLTSPFLNLIINIWWLILLIRKKQLITPKWLLRTNLVVFIFQIFILWLKM